MNKVGKETELPTVPLKLFEIENTESFRNRYAHTIYKHAFWGLCKLDCNYGNERTKYQLPGDIKQGKLQRKI